MKLKIVGFKVGKPRPTANRTVKIIPNLPVADDLNYRDFIAPETFQKLGEALCAVLNVSDFISIRRVND